MPTVQCHPQGHCHLGFHETLLQQHDKERNNKWIEQKIKKRITEVSAADKNINMCNSGWIVDGNKRPEIS